MNTARVVPLMEWENVLFPGTLLPLHISLPEQLSLVNRCLDRSGEFGVLLESDQALPQHRVGTLAKIIDYQSEEDGETALLVTGLDRFKIAEMIDDDPYLTAMIEVYPLAPDDPPRALAPLASQARRLFGRCVRLITSQRGSDAESVPALPRKITDLGWAIAAALAIHPKERQRLLEKETSASLLKSEILFLHSLLTELRHEVGD